MFSLYRSKCREAEPSSQAHEERAQLHWGAYGAHHCQEPGATGQQAQEPSQGQEGILGEEEE